MGKRGLLRTDDRLNAPRYELLQTTELMCIRAGTIHLDPSMQNRRSPGISIRIVIAALLLTFTPIIHAWAEPAKLKKVLVLFASEGWSSPAERTIYGGMKAVFDQSQQKEIVFMGDSIDQYFFRAENSEQRRKADSIRTRYIKENINVVVPVGPGCLEYVLRHREVMFPGIPIVFCAHSAYELQHLDRANDVTGVAVTVDIAGTIDIAMRLQLGLRQVALIAGTGPLDVYLAARARSVLEIEYSGQLGWLDLTGLPMDELLARVSILPERTALLFINLTKDGSGVPFVSAEAMQLVSKSANAPLYNLLDTALGYGSVGGRLTTIEGYGRKAAEIVLRVLGGESASSINPAVMSDNPALFDWRELRRWGFEESDLPPGSIIYFKDTSLWEAYRWWVIGTFSFTCLMILVVFILASNLIKRKLAEQQAARTRNELAHIARVSTVGQLGQSLAHEINQPLAAIRVNAEVAGKLLAEERPDLEEVRAALTDIVADNKRAQEVIACIRSLVRNSPPEHARVDLNQLATSTAQVMSSDAASKGIDLRLDLQTELPHVIGDNVQLQQVVMNLVLNAVESVSESLSSRRVVTVKTAADHGRVRLSVRDTGPGIGKETVQHLFEPFFSTKPQGLGLGLSICRTIAEAHGGSLDLVPHTKDGAEFCLYLPVGSGHVTKRIIEGANQ